MSLRFRICLLAWIAVVVLTAMTGQVNAQTPDGALTPIPQEPTADLSTESAIPISEANAPQASAAEWVIEIVPAHKVVDAPEVAPQVADGADPAAENCPNCGHATANAADYTRIYNSIPFNRAEYDANPTYRHDSAMEILTGNARHKTIVRHGTSKPATQASAQTVPAAYPNLLPYGYIRPAVRFNYYRYFPSLRPTWNPSWYFGGY